MSSDTGTRGTADGERPSDHRYGRRAQRDLECGAIIRGVKKPTDCKIFGTVCTPRNPIGSCMVSSEGACAAYYKYRRHGASENEIPTAEEAMEPNAALGA